MKKNSEKKKFEDLIIEQIIQYLRNHYVNR